MEKTDYFIRRLLLVFPTFIGITMLCFAITQFVPGGPVDQMMMRLRGGAGGGGEMTAAAAAGNSVQAAADTEAQRQI